MKHVIIYDWWFSENSLLIFVFLYYGVQFVKIEDSHKGYPYEIHCKSNDWSSVCACKERYIKKLFSFFFDRSLNILFSLCQKRPIVLRGFVAFVPTVLFHRNASIRYIVLVMLIQWITNLHNVRIKVFSLIYIEYEKQKD